jgi:hypothetical protein
MTMPQLTSKQYKVEIFTPLFLFSGILEPIGALMPYLSNIDRHNIPLKQVTASALDQNINASTFNADELWIPRRETLAIRFLEVIALETMKLLPNREKLRVFLPHILVQGTFSRGPDTKLSEIFEATSGEWMPVTEALIYPLHPTKTEIKREADMMLIMKYHIQLYQPIKE